MQTLRRTLAHSLIAAVLIAICAPHPLAGACSGTTGSRFPTSVLGLDEGWMAPEGLILPSNAAGPGELGGELFSVAGTTFTRIPSGSATYETWRGEAVPVSDTPDLEAPVLGDASGATHSIASACEGCAYGAVDLSTLTLTVNASDDLAGPEQLTFAIYLGETAEGATAAAEGAADLLAMEREDGLVSVALSRADTSRFLVVRVLDQAGNASAPGAAVAITR